MTTAIALDKLLEAIGALDQAPDGLRELATGCLTAGHLANAAGSTDQARVWAALLELVIEVAQDHVDMAGVGEGSQ